MKLKSHIILLLVNKFLLWPQIAHCKQMRAEFLSLYLFIFLFKNKSKLG